MKLTLFSNFLDGIAKNVIILASTFTMDNYYAINHLNQRIHALTIRFPKANLSQNIKMIKIINKCCRYKIKRVNALD